MKYNIAVIPGDGIGPEIIDEAVKVLDKIGDKFGHEFNFTYLEAGGCAIDKYSNPLPDKTLKLARESDSVLLGAVGGPKWENIPNIRPEQALLGLREGLNLYANLRPCVLFDELKDACPLKSEIIEGGLDILIVRELTGGIYFGDYGRSEDGLTAYDTEKYSAYEIERVLRKGAEAAIVRNKKITIVDKANVLESSRLWREVSAKVMLDYPEIEVNYMYVDNAAMQLIRNPKQFDVIVTSNMFGDILSDEASQLTGSIGMLPSASLGDGRCGMYEPIHGSAPDIAGENIANPIATILSAGMMLRYSFNLQDEANAIDNAVKSALKDGIRTVDIAKPNEKWVKTNQMGDEIVKRL